MSVRYSRFGQLVHRYAPIIFSIALFACNFFALFPWIFYISYFSELEPGGISPWITFPSLVAALAPLWYVSSATVLNRSRMLLFKPVFPRQFYGGISVILITGSLLIQYHLLPAKIENDYQAGLKAHSEKRYADAVTLLEKTVLHDPGDSHKHFALARAYEDIEQDDKAIEHWRITTEIDNNASTAYNNLGVLYLEKGDCQTAINWLLKALQENADDVEGYSQSSDEKTGVVYKNLSWCHLNMALYTEAREYVLQAVELFDTEYGVVGKYPIVDCIHALAAFHLDLLEEADRKKKACMSNKKQFNGEELELYAEVIREK